MSKREGAVNGFLSAVGVAGGLGVCASGVGTAACAVGAIGAVASGNHLYGDVQQIVTGTEARSALVQALTANGISATDAAKYQAYIDAGVVVVSLGVAGGQAVYRFTVNGTKVNAADRTALELLTPSNIANFERQRATYAAKEILSAKAVGSALKDDPLHRAASYVVDKIPEHGRAFIIRGGDGESYNLTQMAGTVDGKAGILSGSLMRRVN